MEETLKGFLETIEVLNERKEKQKTVDLLTGPTNWQGIETWISNENLDESMNEVLIENLNEKEENYESNN